MRLGLFAWLLALALVAGCVGGDVAPQQRVLAIARVPPERAAEAEPRAELSPGDVGGLPAPFRSAIEEASRAGHASVALTPDDAASVYRVLEQAARRANLTQASYYKIGTDVFEVSETVGSA